MDEKFSLNDIAQLLAEQAAIEPAKSEKFINELVELINEGIRKDGIVRIKGFGTFRIILIKERESVHVNTGERIVIPAHHRLSFKPDDELKELINKPFSIFETIEDTDEVISKSLEASSLPEDEDSEELEPLQAEEQPVNDDQITKDEQPVETPVEDKKDEDNIISSTIIPIGGQEAKDITPIKGEDKPITKTTIPDEESEAPWVTDKIRKDEVKQSTQEKIHKKKRSSHHKKKSSLTPLYIILGILVCVLIGCVWYYFAYSRSFDTISKNYDSKVSNEFSLPADTAITSQEKPLVQSEDSLGIKSGSDTVAQKTTQPPAIPPSSKEPVNTPQSKQTSPASKPVASTTKPSANQNKTSTTSTGSSSNVLAKITMESGNRLTLVAQKYYGNKIFWVYIYEFNKEKIGSNPDDVKAGMELLIPTKEVYGIDANSAESREKARKLQTQIMSGKK